MNKILLIHALLIVCNSAVPQNAVLEIAGQEADLKIAQILIPLKASPAEKKAGEELQKYLGKITGVKIPVADASAKIHSCEFVIGNSNHLPQSLRTKTFHPDGFSIRNSGTHIFLVGGSRKGSLYAVYSFLEKYLGCRFLAPDAEIVPVSRHIVLPELKTDEQPAFLDREVYYTVMEDSAFLDKSRCTLMDRDKGSEWGLWVHTLFRLVPPDKYFVSHPEYYALMGGQRRKTQLCLSNPDVLKIVTDTLGKMMTGNPGAKFWSVSQMDTYGNCECSECSAINEREGSPSGSYIGFINRVASAYPGSIISTLAYQFTRKPPALTRPASNVNIMLCTIECDRRQPIARDTSSGSFINDIQGWSKITNDILVWDYVIQFTNMTAPFPNFHVLQPNLQMFRDHGATRIFEQGCHGTYSEFQELRAYLLSRLEWNPDLNVDSLIMDFTNGYYGKAGKFIRSYIYEMQDAVKQSDQPLWIYSSPQQETSSFLSPEKIRNYNEYFDRAEKSVAGDSALEARVAKARLPLRYAILEIACKNILGPDGFLERSEGTLEVRKDILQELEKFTTQAVRFGVNSVHEGGLSVDEYAAKVNRSFLTAYTPHLAVHKSCKTLTPPSPKYMAGGEGSLTDGKRGSTNYFVLWQGWEGEDFQATVDLGKITGFNYVGAEFLQNLNSWIFYPEHVAVSVSSDGNNFREIAVFDQPVDRTRSSFISESGKKIPDTRARYVRFFARGLRFCPEWHTGHSGKAWIFVDEVIVDRK